MSDPGRRNLSKLIGSAGGILTLIFLIIYIDGVFTWPVTWKMCADRLIWFAHRSGWRAWLYHGVWLFWWLGLWCQIASLSRNPKRFMRVFHTSWVAALGVGIGSWVLGKTAPGVYDMFATNPVVTLAVAPGFKWLTIYSYGPLLVVDLVLLGLITLGLGQTHPLEDAIRKKPAWPRCIKHWKYMAKAWKRGQTYLGFDGETREAVYLSPDDRNKHIHVVGSTGSGKTRFVVFPMLRQDIEQGRGLIFIDAKGSLENAKSVWKMVQDTGRQEDFLFFSLTHPKMSNTYSPLYRGNSTQLKDKIVGAIDWSEPFYQRICENALQILFKEFEGRRKQPTLQEVYKTLQKPPAGFLELAQFSEQNKKNIQTLAAELGLMVNTPFAHLFDTQEPEIDLLKVYKEGKIAYFALDTQTYQQTAQRFGKMVTQDINTLSGMAAAQETGKNPLAIFIDEFQAFGTRGFINVLARGRSSNLWITIAHQSMGDLEAIDIPYSRQIIENTNTKVFLRVNDPESAQLFADTVGTNQTVETTTQTLVEGSDPKNLMGSQRVVHEYRIHPTEVKELEVGHAVFKSGNRYRFAVG